MVTETAPGTATPTETPSSISAAPSEEETRLPSSLDADTGNSPDETSQDAGDEDNEDDAEPAKPLDQWTLQELSDKADKEGLKPEEHRRFTELQRAEQNRQRDYAEQETKRRKQVEDVVQRWTEAPNKLSNAMLNVVREILPEDAQLTASQRVALQTAINGELQGLFNGTTAPLLEVRRDRFKAVAADNGLGEMQPADLRRLGEMEDSDIDQLFIGVGYRKGIEEGRQSAADKDHVVVTKKQYDAWTKADKTAEKAETGGDKVPPETRARRGAAINPKPPSKDEIKAMSPQTVAEWLSDPAKADLLNKALAS